MSEDIWSKECTLNREKIAERFKGLGFSSADLNKMVEKNVPIGLGLYKTESDQPEQPITVLGNTQQPQNAAQGIQYGADTPKGVPDVDAPTPPENRQNVVIQGDTPGATLRKENSAIPTGLGLGKEYTAITKSNETRNIAEGSSQVPWWKKVKRHNDLIQE